MKIFFDTEFHEDGKIIDLISIGMIHENGRQLYCVSSEFDEEGCNYWVKRHVLPVLCAPSMRMSRAKIAEEVRSFCRGATEFWAWQGGYDWVVLNQLFGSMEDHPWGWPYHHHELKQLMEAAGVERADLPKQDPESEHHAHADALWNRDVYDFVMGKMREKALERVAAQL